MTSTLGYIFATIMIRCPELLHTELVQQLCVLVSLAVAWLGECRGSTVVIFSVQDSLCSVL